MRSSFWLVTIAGIALSISACDAKATADDCSNACNNVTKLFLGEVQRQTAESEELKEIGQSALDEAEAMAKIQLEFLQRECESECNAKASKKQTECMLAAKSNADLNSCQ